MKSSHPRRPERQAGRAGAGGAGKKVCFYTAKGRVAIAAINSNDATIPLTTNLGAGVDFVRAELRAHPHLPFSMTAISNPIYCPGP